MLRCRSSSFAAVLFLSGIAQAQDPALSLVVTGVQLSENDFQVHLENRSSKTITAFALAYSFTYKNGKRRVWGNNVDYMWGLIFMLPETDDPAAIAPIKPGGVRYVRQPFLRDTDGALPTAVDNVGITAVIFDDATGAGQHTTLDDMFADRKEIDGQLSRWLPEFEAAERSANPAAELRKLAKRLGTVPDAPQVVGGISSTQQVLKQMVDSMLAFGVAPPSKAFETVRSMTKNIKAHSSRRNPREGAVQ